MHINTICYLGPNKWYDAGDERFHPDNIIWAGRQTTHIAIIDHLSNSTWGTNVNVLMWGPLAEAKTIYTGDTLRINLGGLDVSVA